MEKVTQWTWRNPATKTESTDSYYFDNKTNDVIIIRNGNVNNTGERMGAVDAVAMLTMRPENALATHSRNLLDYLKARGF
jgi:hypothetical protein